MINLSDLGIAYRKAKVDLYYSSHCSLNAIVEYEKDLHSNLNALLEKIRSSDETWVTDRSFIGTWTLMTKSVQMDEWRKRRNEPNNNNNNLIFSSPTDEWNHALSILGQKKKGTEKPKAEFRITAKCSLDFHVLSTLWMLEVGHLYDAELSESAYGNRLRRKKSGDKGINKFSLGTFKPYLKPFRDWRDNGIQAMRTALAADKKIVALTADVTSFYHELNPEFMLNPKFIDLVIKSGMSEEKSKLNRLFISALQAWGKATPLKKGLPVGLPASAVVANMALIELDRFIEQQVTPIYYGRYVDDILLVMENGVGFTSTSQLWEWLFARSDGKLSWIHGEQNQNIQFRTPYLSDVERNSNIYFSNAKNKVFLLAGEPGTALVDAIAHQIKERASEWRAMPRLPRSAESVETDLLAATQSDGEMADNLRKADALTMRRAGFSIKLRDFEAYERDLRPEDWAKHRRAFFRAFIQHVIELPQFFDLSAFLPRVIRLATACSDFEEVRKIINALDEICRKVQKNCRLAIKACDDSDLPSEKTIIRTWRNQIFSCVLESIIAAFPTTLSKVGKQAWDEHLEDWHLKYVPDVDFSTIDFSIEGYQKQHAQLFSFDLAYLPFRFIGLPKEIVAQRGLSVELIAADCQFATKILPNKIVTGVRPLVKWMGLRGLPHGVLFATRPYSLPELYMMNKNAFEESERADMEGAILAVRGFLLDNTSPVFDEGGILQIPYDNPPNRYRIAVTSWKTRIESWTASVKRAPDPDAERYSRLCRLLDGVIAQPHDSRYLILPELSIPAHWFIRIARKLRQRNISLIAGIEYLHDNNSTVRNQVWASLLHDGLGFPSHIIYCQDKQRAALHEERMLHQLAGIELSPRENGIWENDKPPLIQHGNFRFALLICSELTNINYRAALRGKVDALFVPEWNQDTETFHVLVESAALDIHAYIIQCNDRQFGDSRIRAPYKDNWKRDVLRVKGGVNDYLVIGEIDVQALRQFQSNYRSPDKPFKPVPDGFEIDPARRVIPANETV